VFVTEAATSPLLYVSLTHCFNSDRRFGRPGVGLCSSGEFGTPLSYVSSRFLPFLKSPTAKQGSSPLSFVLSPSSWLSPRAPRVYSVSWHDDGFFLVHCTYFQRQVPVELLVTPKFLRALMLCSSPSVILGISLSPIRCKTTFSSLGASVQVSSCPIFVFGPKRC